MNEVIWDKMIVVINRPFNFLLRISEIAWEMIVRHSKLTYLVLALILLIGFIF